MDAKELAKIIYDALEDKLAVNTSVIDISGVSVLADYFIITGGNNENHLRTLSDSVQETLYKDHGIEPKHVEGYGKSNWILLDYGDVIVHIFNEEDRLFYDLEKIWADGKTVEL